MTVQGKLNRRRFLAVGATATSLGLLAACAPAAQPSPTQAPKATEPPKPAATQAPAAATTKPAATAAATQAPAATKAAAGPKKGGTFTLARTAGIQSFKPHNMELGHYGYMRALYSTLIHYDANLKPQPELAEKWDFSADGKTMTLKLRQGVKFHSGREFTSADVKGTWEYTTTEPTVTMRTLFQSIKAVETPDKYTAVLKFDSVNPGIYDALDVLYIVDKAKIADSASTADGTGPFKLDKYIPNDRAEFVPFADYWDKGKPYLDRYILRQIPDNASLVINLESGAVDAAWQPAYSDIVRLKGSGGKFVADMGAKGTAMFNLAVNVKVEPFTNKKVRQAMAWCIDRARFSKTIMQGLVEPTCLMWPSHSWGYAKDLEGKIGFDTEKAKALLKEAGLEKGFETEIVTASKRGFGYGELPQMIQADLAKIGVKAKVTDLEPAQYTAQFLNKGDFQLAVHTYARLNRDPGSLVTAAKAFYTDKEGGWCHYENSLYDDLRKEMQATLDQAKRQATARKIQELMLDESFVNPVTFQERAWLYGGYVKGFAYDMDNVPFVSEIWLDK
ncbi:MAG: ABC transporter substrate-binding protein [Chloroflexota bacterium]